MHCADCTICFLHLQKGGREERGVVPGGENAAGRERVKQRREEGEEDKKQEIKTKQGREEGERVSERRCRE